MAVRPPPSGRYRNCDLTSVFLGLLYGLENLPCARVVTIIAYDVLRLMGVAGLFVLRWPPLPRCW